MSRILLKDFTFNFGRLKSSCVKNTEDLHGGIKNRDTGFKYVLMYVFLYPLLVWFTCYNYLRQSYYLH